MLIDTHVLIWVLRQEYDRFGLLSTAKLNSESLVVSVAVLAEIELKRRKGKLDIPTASAVAKILESSNTRILALQPKHIAQIPPIQTTGHKDPFDLFLTAQAIAENLPLLTQDGQLLKVQHSGFQVFDCRL